MNPFLSPLSRSFDQTHEVFEPNCEPNEIKNMFFVSLGRREFGLERFVPSSLLEGMKRKEVRRLMAHFLKLNSQMTGSSKMLTQLQVN